MSRSCDVSRSLEPDSRLARAEGCLRRAVLRETREEPFKKPLPDLVVDLGSPLFLQDFVTMNSQDVDDTTDPQTLSEKGKFRLRVLAELNALMHGANDICLAEVMNCCDPIATPSMMLPEVTAEILAMLRTSSVFHSGGAAFRSFTL